MTTERPPSPPSKPRLYLLINKACPYAQRVEWLLRAIHVDHDLVEVNMKEKPEWYKEINPRQKVPALELPEGPILIESQAISWYLLEKYPEVSKKEVLTDDPLERYHTRLALAFFDEVVAPAFYQLRSAFGANGDPSKKEFVFENLRRVLKEYSGLLPEKVPLFLTIMTYPWFYRSEITQELFEFDIPRGEGYQKLNEWLDSVEHDETFHGCAVSSEHMIALYEKYGFRKNLKH